MKDDAPYCKVCGGCGEDGCCSYLSCFANLIEKSNCEYPNYLKDATFDRELSRLGFDIVSKIENGLLDAKLAVSEYHKKWSEIYDKIYSSPKEQNP